MLQTVDVGKRAPILFRRAFVTWLVGEQIDSASPTRVKSPDFVKKLRESGASADLPALDFFIEAPLACERRAGGLGLPASSPHDTIHCFRQGHGPEAQDGRRSFRGLDLEGDIRALVGSLEANAGWRVNRVGNVIPGGSYRCNRNRVRLGSDAEQGQLADFRLRPQ
jgi:hypothetical protein